MDNIFALRQLKLPERRVGDFAGLRPVEDALRTSVTRWRHAPEFDTEHLVFSWHAEEAPVLRGSLMSTYLFDAARRAIIVQTLEQGYETYPDALEEIPAPPRPAGDEPRTGALADSWARTEQALQDYHMSMLVRSLLPASIGVPPAQ